MRRLFTSGTARLVAVFASLTVVATVPVALGADSPGLRVRTAEARAEESSAREQTQAAVLTLYALETELTRARSAVAAAESRRAAVAGERASARRQVALARSSMRVSERRLAELVRALYEQDGADPLAILLGAGSLEEALTGLDSLDRAAAENREVLERAAAARARLAKLDARLGRREAELVRVSEAAQARLSSLEEKAAERAAYIDSLRRLQGLTAQRISTLEAQARAAERRAETPQAAAPQTAESSRAASEPAVQAAVAATSPATTSGRTLTVSALGYSLPGRTATGLPVGHGIVAVDPSVIPLGTRMFVPGYGEAVAADTGGAIQGAVIDLWFPTTAAALRWGRRTVVITLR